MTKSLTKLWLQGLKRLMTSVPAMQAESLREATKTKRSKPDEPAGRTSESGGRPKPARVARESREAREPRESRVRPRAGAWTKGDWTRSYHSAPPLPGQLVNHLSYGLYIPPKAVRRPM